MIMKKAYFNDDFKQTQAVINGTKTQFRQIVPQKAFDAWNDIDDGDEYSRSVYAGSNEAKMRNFLLDYSQYKVGEEVAVAQCYRYIYCQEPAERLSEEYSMWFLKQKGLTDSKGWRNKIFVKAEYMPHKIEITDIRVQRLQDISEEDCLAEGIAKEQVRLEYDEPYDTILYNFPNSNLIKKSTNSLVGYYLTAKEAYAALIDQISGKGTWERNPYCFCYTFQLVK